MALAMTRPWKHPKTGIFWLRKRVPRDLLGLVGRKEEKRSLKTRDPAEAKLRLVHALLEVDARWTALRTSMAPVLSGRAVAPSLTLSEREAHQRAHWMYCYWLNKHRENPSEQAFWRTNLYDRMWASGLTEAIDLTNPELPNRLPALTLDSMRVWEMERWCRSEADLLLEARDLDVDEPGRCRLAKALAASVQRASLDLERLSQGHVTSSGPAVASAISTRSFLAAADHGRAPLPFEQVYQGWVAEKRPAERTRYEWRRVLYEFSRSLGHDDARKVTASDLVTWKGQLIEAGRQAKTIRDARLAPLRAMFQWAVDNGHLAINPAERITIDVQRKAGEKKRSFTDEEAALILRRSLRERDPVRRWVPWLCAYTGARISEVCQLHVSDIRQVEGFWAIKFDPEAGSLKNSNSERVVPLHPALIEHGILLYVEQVSAGPLFASLAPDKFGKRRGNGTKVLGRWVRSLGLTDPRLSPVHSWRHRFITCGRRFGLAPDLLAALTGHAHRTVADGYGEYPMSALNREILKIPNITDA